MNQVLTWLSHPGPQTLALQQTEFEILYGGARGGGKTDAGLAWLLRHIDNPKYRALIIRKNADDLSDWVDRARDMYRGTGATIAYRPAVITFPSGAIFRTGHLKDDNAYGKYLGHEYQRMVIEELTQIPMEENYLKLISSCRSTIDIKPQVFCTTNPGGLGHAWVKARFVDMGPHETRYTKGRKTRIFIPAKITDNPTLIKADPTYIDFLDNLPEQLRKAWREGDWNIVAGQVFSEWSADHIVEPFKMPDEWKKWIALDWGINAPSAVGWYAQNYDGRTFLYRELYMNGIDFHKIFGRPLTPKRLARVIIGLTKDKDKNKERYDYCVADPSLWNKTILGEKRTKPEGESIAEIMIKAGLTMIRGDNDRLNGLARYREALAIAPDGKPWYQVFRSCKDTIREIPALQYDLRKIEDVDTDGDDHTYDRDRYFFMSRPYKPVKLKEPPKTSIAIKLAIDSKKWETTDEKESETYTEYL